MRYLLLALLLVSCAPALEPTAAPEGYSLTLTAEDGYTLVRLEVGAPVERAYLVVTGSELAHSASECEVDAEGDLVCILGPLESFYELPVGGEVTRAAALVCSRECYAIRTP